MDLVGHWVAGWAASRQAVVETAPLLRVLVRDERREVEYVGGPAPTSTPWSRRCRATRGRC